MTKATKNSTQVEERVEFDAHKHQTHTGIGQDLCQSMVCPVLELLKLYDSSSKYKYELINWVCCVRACTRRPDVPYKCKKLNLYQMN